MAYAAVISLQKTIKNLLDSHRLSLIPPSQKIIKIAYNELKPLKEILQRLDESSKSNSRNKVNALDARIKEAVWKFEDLLESHVYNQTLVPHESETLEVNLEEIRHEVDSFTKMLKEKEEEYIYELDHLLPEDEDEEEEEVVAACEKKFKLVGSSFILSKIRVKLKPELGLDCIPVVGMAGIGKTTIAKEIFDDPSLFTDFKYECRAWVKIGRKCKLDKLKRDILVQLDPKIMEGDERNEGYYLREILKAKRCLIVLDDVWETYVYDHLKSFFPNFGPRRRSRVLLTTRLQHVATHIHHYFPMTICVELLSKDESWDLLRQRVFGEEEEGSCPPHGFIKAGKKIAEKCDGLPLMIVAVADLLTKADDKSAEYWEKVAESKNSEIFMAAYDQISKVLFPSYEYLPQHLKPCFLHMGVFPPKYEISRFKLLSMWIAEGFLDPNIEECGGKYLGELIDHNVVISCQKSHTSDPRVGDDIKTCRLHSAFWHLCNREATNNKFFRVLSSRADGFQESLQNQRRLSFHNNILLGMNDVFESVEDGCASTARSLLCYGPYHPYQVPICFGLRLLKLLDALQIRFYEFPAKSSQLVFLRYLALTYNGELPVSISNFWNLQFLIIHRNMSIKHSGTTSFVPVEIWDMKELKHIEIMGSNLPNPRGRAFSLESLLTLKGVGVETCTKEVLERIPILKKLGIQIELDPNDDDDHRKAFHCLDHVHVLRKLVSLKCVVVNPKLRSETVSLPMFPRSLKKLHLSGLGYPWEYMSTIVSLPNLQVLKLRCYAFRGPKWEVKEDVMSMWRLKYLLIEGTDLVQFKVKRGELRSLRSLCIKHCYKLQHLQFEPDLSCPFEIEVVDCSPSTVTFANEIRSMYRFSEEHQKFSLHSSWDDGKKLK